MLENEQECSQSLYFFIFLVMREQYSSLQSDQGAWQVEAGVEVERAGPFFGDRHRQGILLLHPDGMAAHPNSSLVFEGGDAFFICLKEVKGALSKLVKSDFWRGGFERL